MWPPEHYLGKEHALTTAGYTFHSADLWYLSTFLFETVFGFHPYATLLEGKNVDGSATYGRVGFHPVPRAVGPGAGRERGQDGEQPCGHE